MVDFNALLLSFLSSSPQPQYWDWDPLPGQSFCSCAQCCPAALLPPAPQQAYADPAQSSGSVATSHLTGAPAHPGMLQPPPAPHRSSTRDPSHPPMPPAPAGHNGHHAAPQSRSAHPASASAPRAYTRSSAAAAGGREAPSSSHAPMDQEVIDVLMNLH
jgi:hypothetical protein